MEMQFFENFTKSLQNRFRLRTIDTKHAKIILSQFWCPLLLCESGPAETWLAVYRRVVGPTSLCTFCPSLAVNISMTFHFCGEDNSHFCARASNHTAREPPRALELRFGGVGSANNCPGQKICHAQELHGGASWRGLMMKMYFFEKSTNFSQNQLRLHTIDTKHPKYTLSTTLALDTTKHCTEELVETNL